MNLNDEQLAALARFLGYTEVWHSNGCGSKWLVCRGEGAAYWEAQWSDADLMLALLNAADPAEQLILAGVISHEAWTAAMEKRKPDFAGKVIHTVAGWPESQGGGA